MNKKFLLTTLLLGSLIALTTTGCFQKADDSSVNMDEPTKMEKEAQPACQIQDEEVEQMNESSQETEEVLK